MKYFGSFCLDQEKDIIVELYRNADRLFYMLRTPNHHTGNLITNLAGLCGLPLSADKNGLKVIRGEIPCYIDANNREVFIFRLGSIEAADIYPDGTVEVKAYIPSISKTLMSQTKDYKTELSKTVIQTYILRDVKFRSDLHTHMNANLHPDILIALGIVHQINYPLYYIRKLDLKLTAAQEKTLAARRREAVKVWDDPTLTGKYRDRRINDHTFINFADLILNNRRHAAENIAKIRASLAIMKDGQAVFTNLEKVYLYRYVFAKGVPCEVPIVPEHIEDIPDPDIRQYVRQMMEDRNDERYAKNTLFQDKLLWIARSYQTQGITYVEIRDTTLLKKEASVKMLEEVHQVMPKILQETGVMIRFIAAFRRIPLSLVKSALADDNYLRENLQVLETVILDPYVVGSDIVGEEINDIRDLKPLIREIVKIAAKDPYFVICIHAGENDNLRDNVQNSIRCVQEALGEGQKMPVLRIGHGLYTADLSSRRGRQLIREIRKSRTILEFQITSNVRLNNLNALEEHPLKQYLDAGIRCVQGTDGAAIYGTSSIDEQLALEKLLELDRGDLLRMRNAEQEIIDFSRKAFQAKKRKYDRIAKGRTVTEVMRERAGKAGDHLDFSLNSKNRLLSAHELKKKIRELPWTKYPVIIAGGSFGPEAPMNDSDRQILDELLKELDPQKYFFVTGDAMKEQEKYLIEHNDKDFEVYAFVPSAMTRRERDRLHKQKIYIRVSTESIAAALYKSINYEIFERRPSTLIAFGGNSAVLNLMQEARNGKGKARIFVSKGSVSLTAKARGLRGYVTVFDDADTILDRISAEDKEKAG